MNDLRSMVRHYVSQLANSDAEDACYSLLERGPVALPHIHEAFRLTHNGVVKVRLAQVAYHSRSIAALPFLSELLHDGDAEIWKCALDGLVYLGWGEPAVCSQVLDILHVARQTADTKRRDWIDEAVDQISWANANGCLPNCVLQPTAAGVIMSCRG